MARGARTVVHLARITLDTDRIQRSMAGLFTKFSPFPPDEPSRIPVVLFVRGKGPSPLLTKQHQTVSRSACFVVCACQILQSRPRVNNYDYYETSLSVLSQKNEVRQLNSFVCDLSYRCYRGGFRTDM